MNWLSNLAFKFTIEPKLNALRALLPGARVHPAGSRYVCSPPRMFTDIDFLIYASDVDDVLNAAGYTKSEFTRYFSFTTQDPDQFAAWRKGNINLIVTSDLHYAETFHTATHICKLHNIRRKDDRVIVHEALRRTYDVSEGWPLHHLIAPFVGPHANTMHKIYRAQHGLVL